MKIFFKRARSDGSVLSFENGLTVKEYNVTILESRFEVLPPKEFGSLIENTACRRKWEWWLVMVSGRQKNIVNTLPDSC